MNFPSLPTRLLEAVDTNPTPRAQLYKVGDRWEVTSATGMLRRIPDRSAA